MKHFFQISLVVLFLFSGFGFVIAQNGNAVVSEIQIYDEEDGTASIEIRISGNNAGTVGTVGVSVSGDRIVGGTVSSPAGVTTRCIDCPTILGTSVPISAPVSGKNDIVDISIDMGNGLIIIRRGKIKARSFRY